MTDRDDIVQTMARMKSLEDWRDEYIMAAQHWRDQHTVENRKMEGDICGKLDRIESRLTSYVNPIIVIILSILTSLVGMLGGALWVLLR